MPSDNEMTNEAVLIALQSVASNMAAVTQELAANREVMTGMRVEMAAMKERQAQHSEFKEALGEFRDELKSIADEVDGLKARNLKQDGAMGFATWAKEFGPWLLSGIAVLFAYFTTRNS